VSVYASTVAKGVAAKLSAAGLGLIVSRSVALTITSDGLSSGFVYAYVIGGNPEPRRVDRGTVETDYPVLVVFRALASITDPETVDAVTDVAERALDILTAGPLLVDAAQIDATAVRISMDDLYDLDQIKEHGIATTTIGVVYRSSR
jgi:hypothetical protein